MDSKPLVCKLSTAELRERKATVIARLSQHILARRELDDGYAFKFPGTDGMLDELLAFIKTERACCVFITFRLSISGDRGEIWLEMTGAEGVKDFISAELGLPG